MSRDPSAARRRFLIALVLFFVVLAAHAPGLRNEFVRFDDYEYIVDNPHVRDGLTVQGVAWAFGTFSMGNWHPLTWLSHMADGQVFGMAPWGHHLVNIVLHGVNAVLLFLVLRLMTGATWPSALVALLFGVHPLRVESVAWASERKDVLAGTFWMLTLLAHARYARAPGFGRYLVVAVCLGLGLMAKPMLVTLPVVLLLLDVWPLRRVDRRDGARIARLMAEKLPLALLCLAASAMTVAAQRSWGAVESLEVLTLPVRVANAAVASVAYLWKTAWPTNLAFFYPHPALADPGGAPALLREGAVAAIGLGALTALAVWQGGRRPFLIVGWSWYVVTLLPVIGIVQVGNQAMADRYTYIPTIGIAIAIAWTVAEIASRRPRARPVIVASGAAIVAILFVATWRQTESWRDTRAMLERALAVTENNYVAHNNLGNVFAREGDLERAAEQYESALAIRPALPEALNNLGIVRDREGLHTDAVALYARALDLRPDYVKALYNLALSFERLGRVEDARRAYEKVLVLAPQLNEAREGLDRLEQRRASDSPASAN